MTGYDYDLLVIGSGAGGSGAAHTAAAAGARVAMVERDEIGGTCLNTGCDPTKTLLHSARLLADARQAERYGLRLNEARADWSALMTRVRQVIKTMRNGSSADARAHLAEQGIDVFFDTARFISAHEVQVNGDTLSAERFIIAAGSRPVTPPIEGLNDAGFITNVEAVALPTQPDRLAILGGGPIGVEFAQMFHRFGSRVTLIEHDSHLLSTDDRELADQLQALLAEEGVRIVTGTEVRRVEGAREGKRLSLQCGPDRDETLLVDEILVAVGYRPALEALNLAAAGVATRDGGIQVDATLRTSVPHIWAVGDVIGGYKFTHVAYDQGRLAARNAFSADPQPFDDRLIPWVVYTDPELAHIGKTEAQLQAEGVAYRVARKTFAGLARAIATNRTAGQVKLLVGADGMILGGHILGAGAGDLLAPIALAMRAGLPAAMLAETMLPYPTMAEAVRWAAEQLD